MLGLLLHSNYTENIVEQGSLLIQLEILKLSVCVGIEPDPLIRQSECHAVYSFSGVSVSVYDACLQSIDRIHFFLLAADGVVQICIIELVDKVYKIQLNIVCECV